MTSLQTSKLLAMKLDAVSVDIVRIYDSVESPYYKGKELLTEARSLLLSSPSKSLKLMNKARKMMIRESLAAQEYNRYKTLIPQLDGKRISKFKTEYDNALMAGKYSKAKSIAKEIGRLEPVRKSGHSIVINLGNVTEDKVRLSLTNNSNADIVIRSLNMESNGMKMDSDVAYPFLVSKASTINVTMIRSTEHSKEGHIHLDYEENGIVKTIEKDVFMEV